MSVKTTSNNATSLERLSDVILPLLPRLICLLANTEWHVRREVLRLLISMSEKREYFSLYNDDPYSE
jgi:hypothetical protein